MAKSARSKAERHFTASQRKDERVLKEREKEWQKKLDHTASLRAQRLAKEEADRKAAEEAAAKKAGA